MFFNLNSFCLLFSILLLSACESGVVYENTVSIPRHEWKAEEVLHFETDSLLPSDNIHQFEIYLRHNVDFPYRNLWLFVNLEYPNGKVKRDTLQKILMYPNGNWKEDVKGSGAAKETTLAFPYAIQSPPAGKYHIYIQHAMRDSVLSGLMNIGFKIKEKQ